MAAPTTPYWEMTEEEQQALVATNQRNMATWRTVMLTVTVPPEHIDTVMNILSVVRTGLCSPYIHSDLEYSRAFEGPFVVEGEDDAILDAIADHLNGWDKLDKNEPSVIRNRAILAGCHALVREATG